MSGATVTVLGTYLLQLLGALVLAGVLGHYHGLYGRFHLQAWYRSFLALAVYLGGAALGFLTAPHFPPWHPLRLGNAFVAVGAGYLQVVWLLAGTLALRTGREPSRRTMRRLSVAALALAAVVTLLFVWDPAAARDRMMLRIGVRSLVAGIAFAAAAFALLRGGGWRAGVGVRLLAVALLLYGAEQIQYFVLPFTGLVSAPRLTYAVLTGSLDFILQFAIGLGLVAWFLDEERARALRAAEALRESELRVLALRKLESLGRLAGGVAHDMNNLLTPVVGYAEMLAADLPPDDPKRRDLREIGDAARQAVELTRQLLAFGRRLVLEVRPLDLNAVVRGFAERFRSLLPAEVELELRGDPNLWPVNADPAQIEHVLTDLCLNAREAMPEGGTLSVETVNVVVTEQQAAARRGMTPGSWVRLSVSDTGQGMDPAEVDRIFEPFYSTKERGRGTGLGLASVYGIVKQHGGGIWVRSRPGRGTRVDVYLPPAGTAGRQE